MGTNFITKARVDIGAAVSAYQGLGLTASFFSFFQGRATCFAILFTICGLIGFFKKYDLTSYALFVGAIQTMVIGHSIKEDYFEMRRSAQATTNAVHDVTGADAVAAAPPVPIVPPTLPIKD
jgi:uncharacterized membrane protein (UPF0136 family)